MVCKNSSEGGFPKGTAEVFFNEEAVYPEFIVIYTRPMDRLWEGPGFAEGDLVFLALVKGLWGIIFLFWGGLLKQIPDKVSRRVRSGGKSWGVEVVLCLLRDPTCEDCVM